jgi:protein involved in polysaccharide export with SLBB domain
LNVIKHRILLSVAISCALVVTMLTVGCKTSHQTPSFAKQPKASAPKKPAVAKTPTVKRRAHKAAIPKQKNKARPKAAPTNAKVKKPVAKASTPSSEKNPSAGKPKRSFWSWLAFWRGSDHTKSEATTSKTKKKTAPARRAVASNRTRKTVPAPKTPPARAPRAPAALKSQKNKTDINSSSKSNRGKSTARRGSPSLSESTQKALSPAQQERIAFKNRDLTKTVKKAEGDGNKKPKRGFWASMAFWRGPEDQQKTGHVDKKQPTLTPKVAKPKRDMSPRTQAAAKKKTSVKQKLVTPPKTVTARAPSKKKIEAPKDKEKETKPKRGFWASLAFWKSSGAVKQEKKPASKEKLPSSAKSADAKKTPVAKMETKPKTSQATAKVVTIKVASNSTVNAASIKPGYLVKVLVLASGRKEVDEAMKRVSSDGFLTLPLVGHVKVEGMSMRNLSDHLTELYAKYLRDPMVDVDFVLDPDRGGSPWGHVTVLGRVKQPGRVSVPPTKDLTLSTAIQLAGGFDSSAKMTGIKITREKDGQTKQFEIDLQSIGDEGKIDSDILLAPGDFIYVPERVF